MTYLSKWFVNLFSGKYVFLFSAILLRVALEVVYGFYINPIHSHEGFEWEMNIWKYLESWMLYIALLASSRKEISVPSDFFIVLLLMGLVLPVLSFYGLTNQSREHLYIFLFGYILIDIFRRVPYMRIPTLRHGELIAIGLSATAAVSITVWIIISGGLVYFNLDLTEVYDYRRSSEAVVEPGLMAYATSWTYKVLGPTLLAIALWRRAYLLAALTAGVYLLWFGVSAHRSILFYPLLVLMPWFWFRRSQSLSVLPVAMLALTLFVGLIYFITNYHYPVSLFVRRGFYVPAFNLFDYYAFFHDKPSILWSNSILAGIIEYPYSLNPPDLLGAVRGTGAHVNNSFLSTGYMHAGIIGIALYGIAAGLLFWLLDSLTNRRVPLWLVLSIAIIPTRTLLIDSDLPTALLTHGFLLLLVMLFLIRDSGLHKFCLARRHQ